MNRRLQGKVALLTGAGGDIGHCIASRYVREGASVLCVDIDLAGARHCAQAAAESGAVEGGTAEVGAAEALECDVADARSAEAAVDAALSLFGRLDILVNNAAVSSPYVPLHELDEAAWRRALDVNLTGAFLMSKYAAPPMLRGGSGCIIHMASQMGHVGAPGRAVYGTTKAALIQLAKIMALDYGPHRIRVNTLSPGAILTSRVVRRYGSPAAVRSKFEPLYPIGRIGTVEDVANAAVFLASEEASFVTGTDLLVDGGYTAQ